MREVDFTQPSTERRRSERVSDSLPLIVRGVDLLGQAFEERTTTLALNLHGCRYASKHHLPKNTWVTLELPQSAERRNVRARVTWIHRPRIGVPGKSVGTAVSTAELDAGGSFIRIAAELSH